ncbi:MAG: glycosyltransferase family 39 protein [Caldilinea sp.]|nr:glycosyltransferase family 39 protein [Caldilinea sp.]
MPEINLTETTATAPEARRGAWIPALIDWLNGHAPAIELLLLALILLLAAGLRAYHLGLKSLWLDEIFFVNASQQGGLLGPYGALSVAHPPAYLFLMRLVSSLSQAEWALRLPAMLASTVGVAALWALGRRLFGRAVGLLAAFFLALSPMHLEFAQEAHSYALFATLGTLLLWGLSRAAQREVARQPAASGRAWRFWLSVWGPVVLVAVLSLYNHYYALAPVGLSLLIFPLLLLDAGRCPLPSLWREPGQRRALLHLLIALLVVGLAFLPQLISQLAPTAVVASQRSLAMGAGDLEPVFRLDLKSFADVLVAFVTYRPNWTSDPLFFAGVTLLWAAGLVWLLWKRTAAGLALSLWIFLPLPVIAWFAFQTGFSFAPRRLIFILPIFMLVVAVGVTASARAAAAAIQRAFPDRRSWTRAAYAVIIAVIVLAFVKGSLDPLSFYYRKPKQDWKTLAAILNSRPAAGDAVALLPSANGPIQWYLTADASLVGENVVDTLQQLCLDHDALYVAEATTRRPLSAADARYLAENFITVPLKDLALYYRNCRPDAWYGAGAEKLFPLAQHSDLAYPPTRRARQEFEALAAQFAPLIAQLDQSPAEAQPTAPPPTATPVPTPTATPTPAPVVAMDARTLMTVMVAAAPDDPLTHLRLGAYALQEGATPEQAGEHFQRAIDLDPAAWLAYGLWANSLANTGQITAALQMVDQGLVITPDNLALQTMQARFQDGAAAATDDAYPAALEAARSALRERQWDAAVAAAEQAIALAPDRYEPQLVLGDAHRGANDLAQALAAYQQASARAPYLSILHSRQAEMLARLGRADDAIAAAMTAVAIDQSRWENWHALGRAYAAQAIRDNVIVDPAGVRLAEAALLRAVELTPATVQTAARALDELRAAVARAQAAAADAARAASPARRAAAQQLLQSGDAEGALAAYRALVATDRQDRESRMGVAAALAALQHKDQALAEFRQISADWPDFPFARLREGMLLEETGDLAAAIAAYRSAVAIAPDNADAHFTLAYALRRDGQRDLAMAEFQAGLALDPSRDSARQALEGLQAEP